MRGRGLSALGVLAALLVAGVVAGAATGFEADWLPDRGARTLEAPAAAPDAPTLLTATPGNESVALTWSAPADGGSPITGYEVYRGTTSGAGTLLTTLGVVTGYVDTTVVNGTTYFYEVSAVNADGAGPRSNERSATPLGVPGAPTDATASLGNGAATVSWSPPESDGGAAIISYTVTSSPGAYDRDRGGEPRRR